MASGGDLDPAYGLFSWVPQKKMSQETELLACVNFGGDERLVEGKENETIEWLMTSRRTQGMAVDELDPVKGKAI